MASSFEEVFLAIAVKNKLLTREAAVAVLSEFRGQGNADGAAIAGLLVAKRIVTQAQAEAIVAGTQRVLGTPPPQAAAGGGEGASNEPVPGYRIVGKLGTGGTATVFLAEDRHHGDRKVALKILQPARAKDEKALAAFEREAELLVRFNHPNLVKGYERGSRGPLHFVAMEYLEGGSVQDVLDQEKHLPEARALEIILEAAKALEYTQQQGIVHRDIKPGNIMVLKDGRIALCDLGFALPIGSTAGAGEQEETTSGTVQYMSPEQARGQRDIDVRADIYSLGASLYHMVMGELPFAGGDSLEIMAKQVMEALNSSEIKNRRISRHMHYFIERMMSKDKTLRYASPRELIDDITEQIEGFRSLEFHPDAEKRDGTDIMRKLSGADSPPPRSPTRFRMRPPGSRRFQKPT